MSSCPVCGSTQTHVFARAWDSEYRTMTDVFTYAQCAACSTVFLDPPPIDRLAEIYPPTYYAYSDGGRKTVALRLKRWFDGRLFHRVLRHLPGTRLRVLDVGGGSGWLLSALREHDTRVVETHELDFDPSARAAAEAAGHVFHCLCVEEFTSPQRFDLIVLLNIIEHVADPAAVLTRLVTVLADGGLILVKTPNIDTLDRRIFQGCNWGGFHCPRHWVLFNRRGFLDLARRCGLDCVWARYTQGAPQWTNSILGWLADRGMLSITRERPMHLHPLHAPLLALTAAVDFARLPFMPTAQMFVLLRRAAA